MRNYKDIVGKRLIYETDTIIYKRFPESPFQKTLPAGKASPVITGYLANGFFQIEGTENEDWYLYDPGENIELVSESENGSTSIFTDMAYWFYDLNAATERTVEDTASVGWEALKDGVGKTKEQITWGARNLAKELRYVLIGIIALLIIILLNKLT